MDRYERVSKPRAEAAEPISENEIRITSKGRTRNYISYAIQLFQEKGSDEIVVKAMGRAINKAVNIVEVVKRRVEGLHQNNSIESLDITDVWEPIEEGLLPVETTRHVSLLTVILSKKELDTSSPGYQPPLPAEQVKPAIDFENEGEGVPSGRGRGRGRGGRGRGRGRGPSNGYVEYDENDGAGDSGSGYGGRPRGRGRARGSFVPGRGYGGGYGGGDGGYGGGDGDGGYDGGYGYDRNDEVPPPGRGRGRRGFGRGRGGGRGQGQYQDQY